MKATIVDFAKIAAVPCPCGVARRAFGEVQNSPITLHRTDISLDAVRHYHKELTEIYYFLECEPGAVMELDDDRISVEPGMAVLIPPGVRHRAIGRMKVVIVAHPKFDPQDEWFD